MAYVARKGAQIFADLETEMTARRENPVTIRW
jgi:hypothetical protein